MDAERLPLDRLRQAVGGDAGPGIDPGVLAHSLGVDLPLVFRRLAALPLAADLPEIGYLSCDASGAVLLRKSVTGFGLPRFGAACPLWPVFEALSRPGVPIRHRLESAEEAVFDCYAIAMPRNPERFDARQLLTASMLLVRCSPDEAEKSEPVEKVGPSCRVCPHSDCSSRREPSILHTTPAQ